MKSEWFEQWFDSPYYHILYKSHDDTEARLFIDNLLKALAPPPNSRILDLACGKGRHARYLAEKGFEVTGLDISAASIAYARHFEHERLTFFQHDMRKPFRVNYYDGIVNMFTSFGYFHSDHDHLKTLVNVQKGLKSGGLFLMDFFNQQRVRDHLIRRETKQLDGIEFKISKTIRDEHVYKKVIFETGGRHFVFRERVRLFSLSDFQRMFRTAGLQLQRTFGDYDLSAFSPEESKRLILIAAKNT